MEGLDGGRLMEHLSARRSFNFRPVYHQDPEYYIKKFRMDLQEAVFDKEVFREELRTQKLKVAKLGKQNLEITETRQELKNSRIMVHVKDVETQKLERNSRNIKGRPEKLFVNRGSGRRN